MAQPIPNQPAVTQEAQQPSVPQPVIPLTPTPEAPANVPLQPETVVIPNAKAQVIPSVAPVITDPLPTLDSNPGVQQ